MENQQKKVLERYSLQEPFSHAQISKTEEGTMYYEVFEFPLNEKCQNHLQFLHDTIIHYSFDSQIPQHAEKESIFKRIFGKSKDKSVKKIDPTGILLNPSFEQVGRLKKVFLDAIRHHELRIDDRELDLIWYYFHRDMLGFGLLEPLMHDPNITVIKCRNYDVSVLVDHRNHGTLETNVAFESRKHLDTYLRRLAARLGDVLNERNPNVRMSIPSGFYVDLWLPPSSADAITIKRIH